MTDILHPDARHAAIADGHVRLGKLKPRFDKRTLVLGKYLANPETGKALTAAKLPPQKSSVHNSTAMGKTPWGMMGNDQYGDCTIAATGHGLQITSAVASKGAHVHTPADAEIMRCYWATGNPTTPGADDNGRVELDVLGYWRAHGVDGSKISAYASIRPRSGPVANFVKMTKYAIDLFGFAYLGVALPITAQRQTTWTVGRGADAAPGSWGGHAIIVVDYDSKGPTCVTWGSLVRMTWGFFTTYCDEAYACLTPEWVNQVGSVATNGVSPSGLNVTALMDDLHSITSV